MTSASTWGEALSAARNSAICSSEYTVGFHARGFWLKIWMDWQPRSSPRCTAFAGPPAGETWAPISMGGGTIATAITLDAPAECEDVSMRVRFPPSPTGALHIGNARTALYNWLLARG